MPVPLFLALEVADVALVPGLERLLTACAPGAREIGRAVTLAGLMGAIEDEEIRRCREERRKAVPPPFGPVRPFGSDDDGAPPPLVVGG